MTLHCEAHCRAVTAYCLIVKFMHSFSGLITKNWETEDVGIRSNFNLVVCCRLSKTTNCQPAEIFPPRTKCVPNLASLVAQCALVFLNGSDARKGSRLAFVCGSCEYELLRKGIRLKPICKIMPLWILIRDLKKQNNVYISCFVALEGIQCRAPLDV